MQKFMMIIKSKRVSSSSNIIQAKVSSSFSHTENLNRCATGNAFFRVLQSINFYDPFLHPVCDSWFFTKSFSIYFTHLLWFSECVVDAALFSSCAIMIIYIFWSFPYAAIKPKVFSQQFNSVRMCSCEIF